MKRLVMGCVLLIICGGTLYGGLSYRAYIRLQEKVYDSWKTNNYIEVLDSLNKFENSLYFRALSIAPRYQDELLYRRAWVEAALGNQEAAAKQFSALGDSLYVGADANFAAGVLSLNSQDLQISKDLFWKALTQNPEHFKARVNLELLLVEKQRQDAERQAMEGKDGKDKEGYDDSAGKKNRKGRGRPRDQFRFKDVPGNQSGSSGGGLQY